MNNKNQYLVIAWLIIIFGLFIGSYKVIKKIKFEMNNRKVEFVIPYEDIKKLHLESGKTTEELLQELKKNGFTNIALTEVTITNLIEDGKLTFVNGYSIINNQRIQFQQSNLLQRIGERGINPNYMYLVVDEGKLFQFVKNKLIHKYGEVRVKDIGWNVLEVEADEKDLRELPLGILEDDVRNLNADGFTVVPRLNNHYSYTEETIAFTLRLLKTNIIRHIIFAGDSVIGYPQNTRYAAEKIAGNDLNFGQIEFEKQLGASQMAAAIPQNTLRVHSISKDELKTLDYYEVVSRYIRAVTERNSRLLYLNLFLTQDFSPELVKYNMDFLLDLQSGLNARGYKVGNLYENPNANYHKPSRIFDIFLFFATIALLSIGVSYYLPFSKKGFILFLISNFFIIFVGSLINIKIIREFYALLTAISAPVVAYLSFLNIPRLENIKNSKFIIKEIIKIMLGIFLISLMAGILINGYLNGVSYFMSVDRFRGVKFAVIVPLLLISIYYFIRPNRLNSLHFVMKRFANRNLTFLFLIVFTGLLLGAVVYILRTGNYGFLIFGKVETNFRYLLEQLFLVRPRTKEFLIGYPALIIGLYFFNSKKFLTWKYMFVTVSIIAYVSLINTFCHFHSPLLITFYRALIGLFLGVMIGLLVIVIINALRALYQKVSGMDIMEIFERYY